jgi:hypothetical protein
MRDDKKSGTRVEAGETFSQRARLFRDILLSESEVDG